MTPRASAPIPGYRASLAAVIWRTAMLVLVLSGTVITAPAEVIDGQLVNTNVADPSAAPVVAEHEPFVATVTVYNPNDRAVKVARLDSTCTCTTLELADHFLLPHGTTTMAVAVDNRNRSGIQRVGISLYLSDPQLLPIEVPLHWQVREDIAVDALPPAADPLARPADRAYQDIYRYVTKVRPDELHRLHKRIRMSTAAPPPGGLRITGIDYEGRLWRFQPQEQADGSILLLASAKDPTMTDPPQGLVDEVVVIRTNHPHKPAVELEFSTYVGRDAGATVIDPFAQ